MDEGVPGVREDRSEWGGVSGVGVFEASRMF